MIIIKTAYFQHHFSQIYKNATYVPLQYAISQMTYR